MLEIFTKKDIYLNINNRLLKNGTYDFYNLTSFEDSKGYLNITFERLFDTKDKYDIAIFPVNIFFKKINLKIKERNHSYYNSMGK